MVTQTLPLPRKGKHPKSCTEALYKTKPWDEPLNCPHYFWRKPELKWSCLEQWLQSRQAQVTVEGQAVGLLAITSWPPPKERIKHRFPALEEDKRRAQRGMFQGLIAQTHSILIPSPLYFVVVDSVGRTISNSTRAYMDLQCPTSAEEQVESSTAE